MGWKSRKKQIVQILYVVQLVVFAGYIIRRWKMNLPFLELDVAWLSLIAILLSLEGSFVFDWFRRLDDDFKREEIKRKEREESKLKHSKDYLHEYFEYKVNTDIGFDYTICNLQLQIKNLTQDIQKINEYNKQVCEYVDEHLKIGYTEVWDIITKRDIDCIKQHNDNVKPFLNTLISKIISELKRIPMMDEWDGVGEPRLKYFRRELSNQIGCCIIPFYNYPIDTNLRGHFKIRPKPNENNLWEIYNGNTLIVSDETEIKNIHQMIMKIIYNELKSNMFETLVTLFISANKEHTNFRQEMLKIQISVDSGIPLKKECDICKDY